MIGKQPGIIRRKLIGYKTTQVSAQASKNNSNNSSVIKIIPTIAKIGIFN